MLQITDLTYRIGERLLFDGASATVPAGAKCGFVGRNGSGKTTLFKLITGEIGPESGHVRVVLTPETRPLTLLEARGVAQKAFLETLKEPGLGDNLTRITVVVRLMPKSHPDPTRAEQVVVYLHKGGNDWSVRVGE